MASRLKNSVVGTLLALGLTLTASSSAFALKSVTNRSVGFVEVRSADFGWQLWITHTDGTMFVANEGFSCGPAPKPVATTKDMIKLWASVAQASLLSGKYLTVTYESCPEAPGYNWITAVRLGQ